ncbi:MAG: hypothetical protein AAFO06_16540 [Cyanobacteria bacterium J06597_16]
MRPNLLANALSQIAVTEGDVTEAAETKAAVIGRFPKGMMAALLLSTGLSVGLSAGLSGCQLLGRQQKAAPEKAVDENIDVPSDIANTQTNVRITVPRGWVAVKNGQQRGTTDIYAVSPENKLYAVVLSESTSVLSTFDLENNAEQYRWLIQKELDSFDNETPTDVKRVGGDPALQYEIRGRVDGTPVVYLHTTVKGAENYYQVVGWTTADNYLENKETLQNIIESFRGT